MPTHTPPWQGDNKPQPLLTAELSHPHDGTVVCTATGEIDLGSIGMLRAQLQEALTPQPRYVVVDLSAVTFLAAAGVAVLEETQAALADGRCLVLVGTHRPVARVLDICGMDYPRYDDLDRALGACRQADPD